MNYFNVKQNNNLYRFSTENGIAKLIQSNISDSIAIIPSTVTYENKIYEVKTIGYGAFSHQQNLKHIIFSEGIEVLDDGIFANSGSLMTIVLPNSLKHFRAILWKVPQFEDNEGGRILYKGSKEEWLKVYKADNRSGMDYTPYEEVVKFVEKDYEFSLPEYDYRIVYDEDTKEEIVEIRLSTAVGEVVIPETFVDENGNIKTISVIGTSAFANNDKLTKVTIPASIKRTKRDAFYGCSNLKEVIVLPSETDIYFGKGSFFNCTNLKTIELNRKAKFGIYALVGTNVKFIENY